MPVKQFVYQSNWQLIFLNQDLTFFKKVENHSVPELENALFFNVLLVGRGIYEEFRVN